MRCARPFATDYVTPEPAAPTYVVGCWCARCDEVYNATPEAKAIHGPFGYQRYNLCPTCGNKRCPRSTAHWLACSGSNEAGQPGSELRPDPRAETAAQRPATNASAGRAGHA